MLAGVGPTLGQRVAQTGVAGDDPLEAEQLVLASGRPAPEPPRRRRPTRPPATPGCRSGPARPPSAGRPPASRRRPPPGSPSRRAASRRGPPCPPRHARGRSAARRSAMVPSSSVGDREQVLAETGPVDLPVQDALERLLDGARGGAATNRASGVLRPGAPALPASPTDSAPAGWLTFSGLMFPASSSARNRSTMRRWRASSSSDSPTIRLARSVDRRPTSPRSWTIACWRSASICLCALAVIRAASVCACSRSSAMICAPCALASSRMRVASSRPSGSWSVVLLQRGLRGSPGPPPPWRCRPRSPRCARRRSPPAAARPASSRSSRGCRRPPGRRSARPGAGGSGRPMPEVAALPAFGGRQREWP